MTKIFSRSLLLVFAFALVGLSIEGTARAADEALAIHAADRIGAPVGKPFVYRIPATGSPRAFSAIGLPPGLSLNPKTGVITGTPSSDSTFEVTLSVKNAQGAASRAVEFVGAKDALALTPMLGWNSWYIWGCNIDDKKIRDAADLLVSSGLAAHGYNYVNIDDCWQDARDARGEMKPKSSFPDMGALAAYVHSKGLRIGIYTSPGIRTCGQHPGSLGHLDQDIASYSRWGMDLVKYDWCWAKGDEPTTYRQMSDTLAKAPRAIVHMICQYGEQNVWTWGEAAGGNSWRTNNDLHDTWDSIVGNGFKNIAVAGFAHPGHWNDLDMLMVGKSNWPLNPHDYGIPNQPPRATRLTADEQLTHMTLWALLSSPLLISADLSQLDSFTKSMLTNDELLSIDQDAKAEPAKLVRQDAGTQIWSRNLSDGSVAVAFFNLSESAQDMHVAFSQVGFHSTGPAKVLNVWTDSQSEINSSELTAHANPHGVVLLKIR